MKIAKKYSFKAKSATYIIDTTTDSHGTPEVSTCTIHRTTGVESKKEENMTNKVQVTDIQLPFSSVLVVVFKVWVAALILSALTWVVFALSLALWLAMLGRG
jgi:hypothetical protein